MHSAYASATDTTSCRRHDARGTYNKWLTVPPPCSVSIAPSAAIRSRTKRSLSIRRLLPGASKHAAPPNSLGPPTPLSRLDGLVTVLYEADTHSPRGTLGGKKNWKGNAFHFTHLESLVLVYKRPVVISGVVSHQNNYFLAEFWHCVPTMIIYPCHKYGLSFREHFVLITIVKLRKSFNINLL